MEKKRWIYAGFGVIVLLFAGMVYAWSVFASFIGAEFTEVSKAGLSLTFTIVMMLFCIGCMVGGLLAGRFAPKFYVWISAVLFFLGFFIASKTTGIAGLYIGFGVICGLASGLAYNAVMSTIGKWFPDKQGLISGILLMGFGISSFAFGKIFAAVTSEAVGAWRTTFFIIGIAAAAVMALCGFFIKRPGADYVVPAPVGEKKRFVCPVAMEATTGTMLKQPSFWLYFVWAILLSAAGLALTSQASGIAREVGTEVSGGTIATVVGLISIANGISRVIFGGLYDKLGRSKVMQFVNILFIIAGVILSIALASGSFALIVLGFVTGGAAYGGVTPTNSAFISSYFGMKNYPMNFSIINTNLLVASFGSTIAGGLYDASGSYLSVYIMIIVLAAVGIAVSFGINICDKKKAGK